MQTRPGYHYVPTFNWSMGRNGTHLGYWRPNRPHGRKKIKTKGFITRRSNVTRDRYGQFG